VIVRLDHDPTTATTTRADTGSFTPPAFFQVAGRVDALALAAGAVSGPFTPLALYRFSLLAFRLSIHGGIIEQKG